MRILIIEDEEKVSQFVVRGLTRFAVDVACGGKSGWEIAQVWKHKVRGWERTELEPAASCVTSSALTN